MTDNHKHKLVSLILAAGNGSRMKSSLPKVMHRIAGKPMIEHVLSALKPLSPARVITIVAPNMDSVKEHVLSVEPNGHFVTQEKPLGTGHAVLAARDELAGLTGTTLVVYGDTPLIQASTLNLLLQSREANKAAIALLGMYPEDPMGYGRLVMKEEPFVERIVECRDATSAEKDIRWVWGGVMAFETTFLYEALEALQPSKVTNEYYLTKLVEIANDMGFKVVMEPMDVTEAMGVNTRMQLAEAEVAMQWRLRERALDQGVTMQAPERVYLHMDTKFGRDVVVQPDVYFGPNVTVGNNVEIRAFSHIEGTVIEDGAIIGPFARLRPGSVVGEGAHVGNFVELKKTKLGKGAKANHLSYVGDTEVGEGANIGAGTITCNYDGINKYDTKIGKGAFIGSNSSLVAPVTIGEGAIIGAGSVITQDVEANALGVARAQQLNVPAKATEIRQRKRKNG
jgi:bifunctional UDP-N-acetylglucosamine pyrophosphorylase / glucosamine-1-phosphate N-acetyltransferase